MTDWLQFLSTPSARRATFHGIVELYRKSISIHALREEGDMDVWTECYRRDISIHALREEGDRCCSLFLSAHPDFYPRPPRGGRPTTGFPAMLLAQFLSTPSARRATLNVVDVLGAVGISIHALREEGDCQRLRRPQ